MGIFNHRSVTLGTDLSDRNNSISHFGVVSRRVFDYAILDIREISRTIDVLRDRGVRFTSLYAHISVRKQYFFHSKEKSALTAAAIIYDFVDGFVVSDFGSNPEKTIDPLLNLRLINDEYREIYLEVPGHYDAAQIDTLLKYVNYSDIDGLLLNSESQFDYISGKAPGNLRLYVNNVTSVEKYESLIKRGAKAVFIKARGRLAMLHVLDGMRFRAKSML